MALNSAMTGEDKELLLSIITINFNNLPGVQATIESLGRIRQFEQVECIFVDGESSDRSPDKARQSLIYRTFISEPDSGIYNAMNKGLSEAKGRYVLWLNSGDRLYSDESLSWLLEYLGRSNADVVSMGLQILDPISGRLLETIQSSQSNQNLPNGTLPHPSTCFKKSTLMAVGGYDEKFQIAADRDLVLGLFFRGCKIETQDEILSEFYSGGASSKRRVHYENKLIDLRYGLISRKEFTIWAIKYAIGTCLMKTLRLLRAARKKCSN